MYIKKIIGGTHTMKVRVTTYLDEELAKKLDKYDNKSKIVKESLNMFFINKDYFIPKQQIVENNIKNLKFQLDTEELKLKHIKNQIAEIDKRKDDRPKDYIKSVYTLKCLPDVSEDDLKFQAERLNVNIGQLKEWLWLDGHYKEIFS